MEFSDVMRRRRMVRVFSDEPVGDEEVWAGDDTRRAPVVVVPTPLWVVFRDAFGVPEGWDPVGAVAIGHPGDRAAEPRASGHTRRRRTLQEVVHHGRW